MPKKAHTPKTPVKQLISDDMLIGDVLQMVPGSEEIMQDFGLHCTSCSVNVFEPIKLGAMSHGIEEAVVDEMLKRINALAAAKRKAPEDGIYVTGKAALKIQEFAKNEEKEGWGLKISAPDNGGKEPTYAMDFQEKAEKNDTTFEFHGVHVFIDKASLPNLLGAEVDFLETAYGSGFKISNPKFTQKAGCACGSGGCGSGGCSH